MGLTCATLLFVQIDLSDGGMRQLADECKQAATAGWSGKQVIHPKQVGQNPPDICNFVPMWRKSYSSCKQ